MREGLNTMVEADQSAQYDDVIKISATADELTIISTALFGCNRNIGRTLAAEKCLYGANGIEKLDTAKLFF